MLATGEARELRIAAGLSAAELASEIGVSPSTIFHWENARSRPRSDLALHYLALLERLERELA